MAGCTGIGAAHFCGVLFAGSGRDAFVILEVHRHAPGGVFRFMTLLARLSAHDFQRIMTGGCRPQERFCPEDCRRTHGCHAEHPTS